MIYLGNIDKKLVMLGGFWLLIKRVRGWRGVGGLVNPLKKKFVTKIFFQIILNEVEKLCAK